MSKAAKIFNPISLFGSVAKSLFKAPAAPDPAPLPARGAADPATEKRAAEQVANREQMAQRGAVAAGAIGSENDADMLGTPKKRAASRTLLGA